MEAHVRTNVKIGKYVVALCINKARWMRVKLDVAVLL